MKQLVRIAVILLVLGAAVFIFRYVNRPPTSLTLTGIVTTNDVVVSPMIGGQIRQLLVSEGDVVKKGQLVAVISPDELRADTAYYARSAEGFGAQVKESEAALRLQERQTTDQIQQAESTLASTQAQQAAAVADLENARLVFERARDLS